MSSTNKPATKCRQPTKPATNVVNQPTNLAVPGVDRGVVGGLAHGGEHEVVLQHVAAAERVVEVDERPRRVEEHVAGNGGAVRDGFEHRGRLLSCVFCLFKIVVAQ